MNEHQSLKKKREKEKSCRLKKSLKKVFSFTFLVLGFHLFVCFTCFLPPHRPHPGYKRNKQGRQQANVSPYDERSCDM